MLKLVEICTHTFVADLLDDNSIVIDLGANEGEFTGKIYNMFSCIIYAVEPVPELFEKIIDNRKVKKFNYCISGRPGEIELVIPSNRCASIYQMDGDVKSRIIHSKSLTLARFLEDQRIPVVDLLKMDIEGAELDLFASLDPKNLLKIKQVTVEFHDFLWPETLNKVEAIKNKLISKGYYCIPFSLTNGDVLFVRQDLISIWEYRYSKYVFKYIQGFKRLVKRRLTAS